MNRGYSKLASSISIAVLLCLFGCGQGTQRQSARESGGAAPEASLQIPTREGSTASIDQYKGKVVLVNFWATWCAPCRIEIPWLIEFNQKYGPKGLVILGVAMDDEGNKVVEPYVRSQRFDVNG
jgi:thiol-disulfide isomerase/thioredoxin